MPASIGRRLAALLYDGFLIIALLMLVGFVATFAYGDGIPAGTWWLQLINVLVIAGFYSFFWSRSGQTLGMRTWRLIALTDSGHIMPFPIAMKRCFYALFSWLLLGAGYLIMLWDPARRTLHERLTQTQTLHYDPY